MEWIALLPALLPAALVAGLIAAVRRPPELGIDVEGGALIVRLHGADAFLCLRRVIEVPVAVVQRIEALPRDALPHPGIRAVGTGLANVVRAGSFGMPGRRTFWDVRRADWLLVVTCAPGYEFSLIVLEVADPRAEARRLRVALG